MSNIIVPFCEPMEYEPETCFSNFFLGILFTLFYVGLYSAYKYFEKRQIERSVHEAKIIRQYDGNYATEMYNFHDMDIIHVVGPKYSGKTALATHLASKCSPLFAHFQGLSWQEIRAGLDGQTVVILDECDLSRRQFKNHLDFLESHGVSKLIIVEEKMGTWNRQYSPVATFLSRHMTHNSLKAIYNRSDWKHDLEFDFDTFADTYRKLSNREFVVISLEDLYTYRYEGETVKSRRLFDEEDKKAIDILADKVISVNEIAKEAIRVNEEFLSQSVYRGEVLRRNERRIEHLERSLKANKNLLKKSREKVKSLKKSLKKSRRNASLATESIYDWTNQGWEQEALPVINTVSDYDWSQPVGPVDAWNPVEHPCPNSPLMPAYEDNVESFEEPIFDDIHENEGLEERAEKTIARAILKWNAERRWKRLGKNLVMRTLAKFNFGKVLDELRITETDSESNISIEEYNYESHLLVFDKGVEPEVGDYIEVNRWQDLEDALDLQANRPIWCTYDLTSSLKDPEVGAKIETYSSWVGCRTDLAHFDRSYHNIGHFIFDPSTLDEAARRGIYFNVCFHGVKTFRTFNAICDHFEEDDLLLCYSSANNRIEWMKKM